MSSSCVCSGRMEGCLCREEEEEELSLPAVSINVHDVVEGRQVAIGFLEGWSVVCLL